MKRGRGGKDYFRAAEFRGFADISPRAMVDRRGFTELLKITRGNAMSMDGLCAIVTGSASGLGAATAAILAKGGGRIVVNYSSSQKAARWWWFKGTLPAMRIAGGLSEQQPPGDGSMR
jgi:hypothetical protein